MTKAAVTLGDVRLRIPEQTSWRTGILGMSGSGKSNTAAVYVEDLFAAEQQVIVVDPVGAWYGLRSSADGKGAGLPIAIIGGDPSDHVVDVPLEEAAGAFIAELVVRERLSSVVDTSDLSESGKARFLADFAETLYRRNKEPLYLVLEEADDYAPQGKTSGPHARTLGAFQRIVKRGRFKGLFPIMVTQRSAALHKDLLTQCDTLIVHRSPSPQDRKAIGGWVEHHGQAKEVLSTLHELDAGEAWVWSPQAGKVMSRARIRRRSTFDSGQTPTEGKTRVRPRTVADVDTAALATAMAATIEKTKATDPKELNKRIRELEREVKEKARSLEQRPPDTREVERVVEVAVVPEGLADELEGLAKMADRLGNDLSVLRDEISSAYGKVKRHATTIQSMAREGGDPWHQARDGAARLSAGRPQRRAAQGGRDGVREDRDASGSLRARVQRPDGEDPSAAVEVTLPKGERIVLTAIAQHRDGVTREQATILTGYKRSTRDAYIQRLREKDLVAVGERIVATDVGITALGVDFEPLPVGQALREHWLARLPAGERAVLGVLIQEYPFGVGREDISDRTGYKRSTRDAYIQRLRARELVHVSTWVYASDVLFEGD